MISILTALVALPAADASSHREAPSIALDPAADITDFYMFNDPNDSERVVLIMNVIPMELPGGGPNFHRFDDNVLYAINIDNEGDGEEDIVFQFRFETTYTVDAFGFDSFIYNIGDVSDRNNVYQQQSYTLTRVDDGVATTILTGDVAPINVGTRAHLDDPAGYNPESSTPGNITISYVEGSGDYYAFAGPRQEGFYVDLERTFDLLNLVGNDPGDNVNTLLGYNVHSMAISVPKTALTRDGDDPTETNQNHVIAGWATTHRRAVTVRRSNGLDTVARGPWVQVSRLGNPLVNEVVIPVGPYNMKDVFSASHPRDDLQFLPYVQDPLLARYMSVVLGTADPDDLISAAESMFALGIGGREDLILIFLTGYTGLGTMPSGWALGGAIPGEGGKSFAAFEALRLNMEGTGFGQWPDGRNPGDDVVDVALSGVLGYLIDGTYLPDGVGPSGLYYLDEFPYLGDPWAGDDHPAGYHDL